VLVSGVKILWKARKRVNHMNSFPDQIISKANHHVEVQEGVGYLYLGGRSGAQKYSM